MAGHRNVWSAIVLMATFAMLTPAASGEIAYVVPAGTVGSQNTFNGVLGMDFDVNTPITITSLGIFDSSSNGLGRTITASLYDRNNPGIAIERLVFEPASPGSLAGGSRFKELATHRTLPAGFQGTIAAENFGTTDPNGNSGGAAPSWTVNTGGGALNFVGTSRFGTVALAYPGGSDGGPVNRYAAGTFNFETPSDSTIAYHTLAGTGNASYAGSLGMDFDITRPIRVTHLGVFDSNQDGIAGTVVADLWSRSGNTGINLSTLSFTSGDDGTLVGGTGSRFKELATPLILMPGTYTISASGMGALDQYSRSDVANPLHGLTNGHSGAIQFVGTARFAPGGGAGFPVTPDSGPANKWASGTFMYEALPVGIVNGAFENVSFADHTPANGSPFGNNISPWQKTDITSAGNYNPANIQYVGADDEAPDMDTTIPDGKNVAFINRGSIWQELPERLETNMTYTLTASFGERLDTAGAVEYLMELLAGDTVIASATGSVADGWVTDSAVASIGPAHALAGLPLTVRITKVTVGLQLNVDAVSLTIVPEPGSVVALALLGFAFARRRGRR